MVEEETRNVEDGDEDEDEEEKESAPGCTLFIKNLNFSTAEQKLQEVLRFTTRLRINMGFIFFEDVDLFYYFMTDFF